MAPPVSLSSIPGTPTVTVFPSDLLPPSSPTTAGLAGAQAAGGGNPTQTAYYAQIEFRPYSSATGNPNAGGSTAVSGFSSPVSGQGIYLPLPAKINNILQHAWYDGSLLDYVPAIASRAVSDVLRLQGTNVNPFLYMLYKQPFFREFEFNWMLSANTPEETQTLATILLYIQTASLPDINPANPLVLDYPYLAYIKLNPSTYLFDFKPCVVTRMAVDYTGGATGPSFYKDGGPTVVSLSVYFKEVEILIRQDMIKSRGANNPLISSLLNQTGVSATSVGTGITNLGNAITAGRLNLGNAGVGGATNAADAVGTLS